MWKMTKALAWTLRIALPKVGVGWMFALLTIDFNRVSIVELGISALIVTALLSTHYFLSPFQVFFGRLADLKPIFGYRRTPYMVGGAIVASLLFMALPDTIHAVSAGSSGALLIAILLFVLFGLSVAAIGDSYHALLAEITTESTRGGVIAVVWIVMIMSTILAAVLMNQVRPEYSPEAMQQLYNLTPFIVIGSTLLGIIGVEKRMTPAQVKASVATAKAVAPPGNPFAVAWRTLQSSRDTRAFFAFVFVAIFAIFLQDNILEVFGAEVFGMTVAETTRFQPTWGGGVLLGMIVTGLGSVTFKFSRRHMVVIGCTGTAVSMLSLAATALLDSRELVLPSLFSMGLFTGIFNIGALSLMMEMTVPGATGLYMGLWGIAQTTAQGTASIGSGALHTALIESGLMSAPSAYGLIFSFESCALLVAAWIAVHVSVTRFRVAQTSVVSRVDVARAMDVGSTA